MVAVPKTIINHGQILANLDCISGAVSALLLELLAWALLELNLVAFGFLAAAFLATAAFLTACFFAVVDFVATAFGTIIST